MVLPDIVRSASVPELFVIWISNSLLLLMVVLVMLFQSRSVPILPWDRDRVAEFSTHWPIGGTSS
jgi:hypothetical protein